MLDETQIQMVQNSFGTIADEGLTISRLFYDRLFELDSSIRTFFPGDMTMQRGKFFQMLALIIGTLHDRDELAEILQTLGARHSRYGVQPHNYQIVGEALLWALENALAEQFTPELRAAWTAVYGHIAGLAIEGAA